MKIPNSLCIYLEIFQIWKKIKGITTLFLKLAEDDNLTGLQTITKKAFHMLISKRITKHWGTICHSKISSLGELFYFLFKYWKVLTLLCFFSTQIDHLIELQTIVKLWTYCLWETVLSIRIKETHSTYWILSPQHRHDSAQFHTIKWSCKLNLIYKNESHSALWHNLAQFNSIWHTVHYWAQYGLGWHIIKAVYLNPITKTSPLVKIWENSAQFASIWHRSTPYIPKFVMQEWFLCTKLSSVAWFGWI